MQALDVSPFCYRDEVHLFHVVPNPQAKLLGGGLGLADAGEFMVQAPDPKDDRKQASNSVSTAEGFIEQRFVSKVEASKIPHQVEITHFNTDKDSIAAIICKRAQDLETPAVVMAKHNQGSIKEFFLGSVSKYCTHHCKQPVIVLH
ncbi:MAG: hypothetical protein FRX49_11618 [Trebouxia sp. A1-2]|nr:MAG: hypothetical protein FRX49_11618 [Trebouxia sp. A1-2]